MKPGIFKVIVLKSKEHFILVPNEPDKGYRNSWRESKIPTKQLNRFQFTYGLGLSLTSRCHGQSRFEAIEVEGFIS
jgi:hypothetical protein